MYHLLPSTLSSNKPVGSAELELRQFLDTHAEPLRHALILLRGRTGQGVHDALRECLACFPAASAACWRHLTEIRATLSLNHLDAGDPGDEARFAAFDPADPLVEEICLLADQLDGLMQALLPDQRLAS